MCRGRSPVAGAGYRLDAPFRRRESWALIPVARLLLLFLLFARLEAADTAKVRPADWAQPVIGSSLANFYRISDDFYRSEQPTPADIPDLKRLGIRTVISLRHYHLDSREFERANIAAIQHEMDAGSVSVKDLVVVLRLFRSAEKPVLLHCWHGSDRTGFVVAGYRMVFMNWTAEQAVEELRRGGYDLHEFWYPNIARVLREMNVTDVKKAVFAGEPPSSSDRGKPTQK